MNAIGHFYRCLLFPRSPIAVALLELWICFSPTRAEALAQGLSVAELKSVVNRMIESGQSTERSRS
jgi:hypothetical protein